MPTIKPTSLNDHPSYHIWLTDTQGRGLGLKLCNSQGHLAATSLRRENYPRTTLQVNSGQGKWTDLQPPFGQLTKSNFLGGLGSKDTEADQTKYQFASNVWTCGTNGVMLAPQWYRAYTPWPTRIAYDLRPSYAPAWGKVDDSYWAVQFTVGASNLLVTGIRLPVRSNGNPGTMKVWIYTDTIPGEPGIMVAGTNVQSDTHLLGASERNFNFTSTVTLTATKKYWVVFYGPPSGPFGTKTDHDYVELWYRADASWPAMGSPDGTTWTAGTLPFLFSLLTVTDTKNAQFFTYKQATYCWFTDADKTTHLFLNGDQGQADDNAAAKGTLIDATKAWTTDEFAGCIARIYGGAGKNEWRTIVSNNGTTLTVDHDWTVTHTTGTTYVIVGSRTWREITGHGLSDVRDACVSENTGIMYFAQGSEDLGAGVPTIVKGRGYNNAGAWAYEWDADNTGGADLLLSTYDQEKGNVIWRARNGQTNNDVAGAVQIAWNPATALTFDSPADITLGSKEQDITGLMRWGNKVGVLCVDRIWAILNGVPDQVSQWKSTWDDNSGRRPTLMSSYLVWPQGNNLFRLVGDVGEDFGPESYDGLPRRYGGQYVDLWSEKGLLLAAKRAGSLMKRAWEPTGESGVYMYRNGGWHPVCQLDYGTGMHAIHWQRMDDKRDRLYMATADGIYTLYMPRTFDYLQDQAYSENLHVMSDGCILLGKMTAGSESLDKWWSSINIYGVDLKTDYTRTEVYYRANEPVPTAVGGWSEQLCSDWTYLGEAYDNISKIVAQVKAKQMWLLIRLVGDGTHTPVLQAVTVDYMARVDSADMWPVTYLADDLGSELNGMSDGKSAQEKIALLDEWARDIAPLTMSSSMIIADGRSVTIERPSYQPLEIDTSATAQTGREKYIGHMNILESGVELYRKLFKAGRMYFEIPSTS